MESCQTGSVHRLASAEAKSSLTPSTEGTVMRKAHDRSLCGESLWGGERLWTRDFVPAGTTKGRSPSGGFAIALWKPSPDRYFNYVVTRRWQVAAALSAAVTTAKLIGDAPTLQAEPTKKKNHNSNASRSSGEGVWGGGASLREAASSPEFPLHSLFGREREGGASLREAASLATPSSSHVSSGGSAREGLLLEKPPPSQPPHGFLHSLKNSRA